MGRHLVTSIDPAFPNLEEYRQAQIDAAASLPADIDALREELRAKLAPFDAFDVVANIWLLNVPKSPETYREWADEGVLAVVEIVGALMVERESRDGEAPGEFLSGQVIREAQEEAKALLTMQAFAAMISTSTPGELPEPYEEIRARAIAHRIAVRGPSYAWQERDTFLELFDDEAVRADVEKACGLSASSAISLMDTIDRIGLDRLTERAATARGKAIEMIAEYRRARSGVDIRDADWSPAIERLAELPADQVESQIHAISVAWVGSELGTTLSFTAEELAYAASCELAETERFLALFATQFGEFRELGRPVGIENVRDRPLLTEADGRYLPLSPHNLHWGLRLQFEQKLKETGTAVFGRYEKHRSRMVERRAVAALRSAARADWAFERVQYDVATDNGPERTEVDGLIRHDSALLIVEAKASSMRASARRVAPVSFKDWLEDEVSAAARQARRARTAVVESGAPVYDANGKPVPLDLADLHHIFEIVVVLADLPAVGPATWLLADAEILPSDPIPWVVSLHELEVICDVVSRPSELIHYLLRRRRMDEFRNAWAVDELDYLMHYLQFGLFWPNPDDAQTRRRPPEQLLSHTEPLDSWYMHTRGERKTPAAKPRRYHHTTVEALLRCLDDHPSPGFLDVMLSVLEASPKEARKIPDLLGKLRRRSRVDGSWHDGTFGFGTFGITIMSCPPKEAARMPDRLRQYCMLKKHQQKADRWVGFGCWAGPPEPVQCAVVSAEPWSEDPELDELVAELPSAPNPTGHFDGRPNAKRRFPQNRPL